VRAALAPHAYFQFTRDGKPAEQPGGFGVQTFTGPAFYTEAEKYQKVAFEDIAAKKAKFVTKASDGWAAMVQHYFVAGWAPAEGEREFFANQVSSDLYSAGVIVPVAAIAPGQSGKLSMPLYAGPQEQSRLEQFAKGFDLVVDYGWLTIIAAPLFWVLEWFHKLTGNWGWAIILVTIALKALFFPLSAASYKSMAKMKTLGPRLQRLKEQYGDDKMKMQQAMMDLYKREKVNPLGGCLPILIQIPVFIALYWVLLGVVEMRGAPWLGWIQDLSIKDPYYILPLVMGATSFIQMKPQPGPARSHPGQGDDDDAHPLHFHVPVVPGRSGAVLGGQQHPVHRPAMADQPDDRGRWQSRPSDMHSGDRHRPRARWHRRGPDLRAESLRRSRPPSAVVSRKPGSPSSPVSVMAAAG
jgi:YidC/Oxa1 family membrane protein insertase